ncbi:MAG: aminotransferase class I/II-fold pyridoxal phosphate-dependent enzyme [Eubacteriales bacterium]|nr:aminotransferase class I/II-fold pyridoxal phosphate-dependent enzyme [Eubacteriales bacterium]
MRKYDFESVIDRKGKDALAVDAIGLNLGMAPGKPKDGYDVIPMWVADMNFATVPAVQEQIAERVKHPTFGYFLPRKEYYDAIIDWQREHNGVTGLTKAAIGYENGVLGGLVSALNVFCSRGDNVLVHSPTYIGFTASLENNGYHIVHSPLVKDEDNIWRMDLQDMEKKIVENHIHAAIFCSPHNPCGRVWTKEEIAQAMELFRKYDVYVISDEIWSDLILGSHKHVPTQSVSEDAKMRTVALYAPSKTFNLAGLIGSYHVIYNSWIKQRVDKEASLGHYNNMNVLSMYGLIGAYSEEGSEWLTELLEVLNRNVDYAVSFIEQKWEGVEVSKPEGTYMLFVDFTKWCERNEKTIDDVEKAFWNVGAAVQDGRMFHGACHLRMNLALPCARVEEAFERMDQALQNIKGESFV